MERRGETRDPEGDDAAWRDRGGSCSAHGIGTGQLYTWRKQLLRGAMAGFVPVELVKPEPVGKLADVGRIDIRRGDGFTVSVDRLVDREALRLVLEIVGELEG